MSYEFPQDPFPGAETERLTRIPLEGSPSGARRRKPPDPWYVQSAVSVFWICVLATEAVWLFLIVLVLLFLVAHR